MGRQKWNVLLAVVFAVACASATAETCTGKTVVTCNGADGDSISLKQVSEDAYCAVVKAEVQGGGTENQAVQNIVLQPQRGKVLGSPEVYTGKGLNFILAPEGKVHGVLSFRSLGIKNEVMDDCRG